MRQKIKQKVEEALQGNRKIEITFKQDANTTRIKRLVSMYARAMLWLKPNHVKDLVDFQSKKKWGQNTSRTMTITLTRILNQDQFVQELCDEIEDIRLAA